MGFVSLRGDAGMKWDSLTPREVLELSPNEKAEYAERVRFRIRVERAFGSGPNSGRRTLKPITAQRK
jgi:hypothetical protein